MKQDRQPAEATSSRRSLASPLTARALAALMVALWLLVAPRAAAFPKARLEYIREAGAESCPDEAALRHAVTDRLGYDAFEPSAPELLLARVSARDGRFSAVLELVAASSFVRAQRVLESVENCGELVAALALSISIAIDPERGGATETVASAPPRENAPAANNGEPMPPSAKQPTKTEPPPAVGRAQSSAAPAPEARKLRFRAGASGHLAFGVEPATAPGGELELGVRRLNWSLALAGRYDAETSQSIAPRGAVHARLRALSLLPCFHARPAFLCGNLSLGSLRARTTGLSDGRADSALFAAAGARLGVEWPLTDWFALRGFADLLLTARPLSGEVNAASVWSVPAASGLFGAGFITEF